MSKNGWPSGGRVGQGFHGDSIQPDLFALAKQAYQAGRFDHAEQYCRKLLGTQPDHLPATALLGLTAGMTGRADLGIELLREVVRRDGTSWGSLNALSTMLRNRGDLEEAISVRLQANALRPGDAQGSNELGLCYLDRRDFESAISHFEEAIRLQPFVAAFHHNLARVWQAQGKIPEAIEGYRRAVKLDPKSVQTYSSLAKLFTQIGQDEDAIECFRRAYEADPNSAKGNVEMANALMEQERFPEAWQHLKLALRLDPDSADAHGLSGAWFQLQGRFLEAEAELKRAIELRPTWAAPYLRYVMGRKLIEADRPFVKQLADLVEHHLETIDDPRDIHYPLGKAYDDLGEYEAAMRHYDEANRLSAERSNKLNPFSPDAYKNGFDKTIATFTPEFFSRHRVLGSESELPILIVGMMRSGTTLLEQVLSSHPDIAAGGELTFWINEGRRLHQSLEDRFEPDEIKGIAAKYLETLRRVGSGGKRVTDKMPQNYMALGLIHTAFPMARIVHCRRHPVDNCLSIYFTHLRASPDFAHVREHIVFNYRQYLRVMDHWRKVLPEDKFIEVDYEEMTGNREPVIRRLIDFLGLEWNDACLHHDANVRVIQTPSMWQARQPIYKSSVERWRNYEPWLGAFRDLLPESDRQQI